MYPWSDIPIPSQSLDPGIARTLALQANFLVDVRQANLPHSVTAPTTFMLSTLTEPSGCGLLNPTISRSRPMTSLETLSLTMSSEEEARLQATCRLALQLNASSQAVQTLTKFANGGILDVVCLLRASTNMAVPFADSTTKRKAVEELRAARE